MMDYLRKAVANQTILLLAVMTCINVLPANASSINSADGKKLYSICAACHLSSAAGVAGMFPPLTDRLAELVSKSAGRDYLVLVIDRGMSGRVTVNNTNYNGFMPAQGPALGNEGIATVLNYLLEKFNADNLPQTWSIFSVDEVGAIKYRHNEISNQQLHRLREKAFSHTNE